MPHPQTFTSDGDALPLSAGPHTAREEEGVAARREGGSREGREAIADWVLHRRRSPAPSARPRPGGRPNGTERREGGKRFRPSPFPPATPDAQLGTNKKPRATRKRRPALPSPSLSASFPLLGEGRVARKGKTKEGRRKTPRNGSYLVDPASSHMLVSKIKPCMSKYKRDYTVRLRMAH
jgi:hypothetical protein